MADQILTKISDTKVVVSVENDYIAVKNVGNAVVELVTKSDPLYVSVQDQHIRYDANFVYIQNHAADTWIVNHNLGKYCSVIIVDDDENIIYGEVHYNSPNQLTITFTHGTYLTGKASLNSKGQ